MPDPAGLALSRFPTAEFLEQVDTALPQIAAVWKKGIDFVNQNPQEARKYLAKNTLTPDDLVDEVPMLGYIMTKDMNAKQLGYLQEFTDFVLLDESFHVGLADLATFARRVFLAADLGPQGIRVNAISAGPIKTLAAAGVSGFRKMLGQVAAATPLRRNVTTDEVGNAAAFLCSDLASGITGEIVYVDAGYSHVGMSFAE